MSRDRYKNLATLEQKEVVKQIDLSIKNKNIDKLISLRNDLLEMKKQDKIDIEEVLNKLIILTSLIIKEGNHE